MGAPTSSANIEFPAAMIDGEIRKLLEEEGVRFKPQAFGPGLELDSPAYDLDTEIEAGIFHLQNPEARYGEFYDLEELLVQKGLPFDRTSYMDWNRPRSFGFPGQGSRPLTTISPLITSPTSRWSAW